MRRTYNTVAGVLLILAAVTGLAVCFAGLIGMSAAQARIESGVKRQLALLDQALAATDAGLRTASASVGQSRATLASIQGTVDDSATAVDDIVPSIEAMGGVVGTELPASLDEATQALTVFASTASVIDQVMTLLGSIPFVQLPAYNPDVPLAESVTRFRDSVDDLGGKLDEIEGGLDQTASNLREIREDVAGVGTALDGLADSLDGTVEVLSSYQEIVASLQSQVDAANEGFESALRWARVVVIVVLVWLAIASLGLLTLGLDLFQRNRVARVI